MNDQQPPLVIFLGDSRHHVFVDIFGDGRIEGSGVGQRVFGYGGGYESLFKDIGLIDVGVDRGQGGVIFGAEEGERRDKRARAHAGDEFKARAIAMRGPADQQTRSERAIVAATRQRK